MSMMGFRAALFASTAAFVSADAEGVIVNVSGPIVDVWSAVDTLQRCKIVDVPDIPARAFSDDNGVAHMIVGSTNFHRMNGPSVLNVTRECSASWNMTGDPDPANFACDEFLDSPVAFPNGTVVALLHTGFPGGRFGRCPSGESYPRCWTVTVGLAMSHNWGETWDHARPPPNHLVAAVPYAYDEDQLASGWGDPSNIVHSPMDGHYYVAVWNRHQVGLQQPGICVLRTRDLMDPSSWRGWNGTDFGVAFVPPYDMKPEEAARHVCIVANLPTNCAASGLTWSPYLGKFVVTLFCNGNAFQLTTSDDLVKWSEPQDFYSRDRDLPPGVKKVVRSMAYPTFMDPTTPSVYGDRNFGTIGREPFLFWVSIGHSPYSDGRHLWATKMWFTDSPSNKEAASGGGNDVVSS